jgi:hypothetical protein
MARLRRDARSGHSSRTREFPLTRLLHPSSTRPNRNGEPVREIARTHNVSQVYRKLTV